MTKNITWKYGVSILGRKINKLLNNKAIGILYHSNSKLSNHFVFIPSASFNKNYNKFIKVPIKKGNDFAYKLTWEAMYGLHEEGEIIVDNFKKLEYFFLNYNIN